MSSSCPLTRTEHTVQIPHAYCTYFDSGYLSRGLALINSLRSHGDDSPIWIMALDDDAKNYLENARLPGVHVLTVSDLENAVTELAPLKTERSRMEYYFTTTPLLVRWVMEQYADPTAVAYLDADLYFFADPRLVFDAMGDGSIGIIEHRYPGRLERRLAKYGRFNVGWVGFRNDLPGRACLDWWSARTLEWCRDTPEQGKYADQGYLNGFPGKFDGVRILSAAGLDLAPWNTSRHEVTAADDTVWADSEPLVFFHFHGLRRVRDWWISGQLVYGAGMGRALREKVYVPYVRDLERFGGVVAANGFVTAQSVATRGAGLRGLLFGAQKTLLSALSIVTRNAIRANA